MNKKELMWSVCLIGTLVLLVGCSSQTTSSGPKMGTPEFYLKAAEDTYKAGDFTKSVDNLGRVSRSESNLKERALPWNLVVTAGLAQGYMELADAYEKGSKVYGVNPTPFRKQMGLYRTMSERLALQFTEDFRLYQQVNPEAEVKLAFDFPTGSAAPIPDLNKVAQAIPLKEPDALKMESQVLRKAVVLSAARAVGAPDDPPKGSQAFQGGVATVPHNTFWLAMGRNLFELSKVFDRTRQDKPKFQAMMNELAMETVQKLPQDKETKSLAGKIQDTIKKMDKEKRRVS
jgi:hypothetical protein